jgi:hypothetical protein
MNTNMRSAVINIGIKIMRNDTTTNKILFFIRDTFCMFSISHSSSDADV